MSLSLELLTHSILNSARTEKEVEEREKSKANEKGNLGKKQ